MNVNGIDANGILIPRPAAADKATGALDEFANVLAEQIKETDRMQKESADLSQKAALGNAGVSLHEAQIAAAKADLHLRLLLQTRNKAVEVYKEIMNMPV